MLKVEVTTQCFWGNEKSLRVTSSLVLKIINLVLNSPEKPELQGKAKMSKVGGYCGFTSHSFEKKVPSSGGQRVYILALPIRLDTKAPSPHLTNLGQLSPPTDPGDIIR